ncbi:hypothetical protein D3C85_1927050 [compost metagenome]
MGYELFYPFLVDDAADVYCSHLVGIICCFVLAYNQIRAVSKSGPYHFNVIL